jgi:hypothetical protein
MRPRRIIIRNTPTIQKENVVQTPSSFKYKIVTSSRYTVVDEDVILVKKTKSCQITLPLNFTEGKKINIKSFTSTLVIPEKGLIDEDWEELALEDGSSVQFILIEGSWYILSSDGLKMS